MKTLIHDLKVSVVLTLVLAVVCCVAYPLAVFAVGQVAFPGRANGSLLVDDKGVVRGSYLLAQPFTGEAYFHPRPSAAGADGYDAAGSSGSNLGPTSQKLSDQIAERITEYRQRNGLRDDQPVPADAVTASGSGLDPHISLANARLQSGRVARARNMKGETIDALLRQCTEGPDLGILGEAGVNVVRLNALLDQTHRPQ